ncbi:RRQRL motif-containing zinc-binding protein [Nocardia sp. CA-120079]|uniref:RRQRL motif-containing zinc-binding protein n=1 Tax=Nocardia sp. CA-120079 TaxID=3239974 RepID=UPI003D98D030
MTAVHDPEQPDAYPWMAAPAHLKTRRQLRAAGLRPNGQAPVAQMERKRYGRRLVAYLFDTRLAAPKRSASPAQLDAVAKAVRGHQARAAERRGIPTAELHHPTDPGPGWAEESTGSHNSQGDNRMSDTTSELAQVTDQPQLGTPNGHGQRIAHLLAVAATNQARSRLERLDTAIEQAQRAGEEAAAQLGRQMLASVERVEERLETIPWTNRESVAKVLADALVWQHESTPVAAGLDQIRDAYAQWGVLIDPDQLSVSIDPNIDAVARQDSAEAECLRAREAAVVDVVSAAPLTPASKTAVSHAISSWRGEQPDPADPRAHLRSEATRRELLGVDLADARLTPEDRAYIEFTVDFLRGDVGQVDLLTSPVLVDPGEEVRGRLPQLLASFARNEIAGTEIAEQISVMTNDDQRKVADAGRAIKAGRRVDFQVWPGYVDREAVLDQVIAYADDAADQRAEADYIVDIDISSESPEMIGISDDIGERITRMAAAREQLRAVVRDGQGLTSMERAQLACTVDDIDSGRILGHAQLPELTWVDERTKAEVDHMRSHKPAAELADVTRTEVAQLIEQSGAVEPGSRAADQLKTTVFSIGDSIYSVASGALLGVNYERKAYIEKRDRLGHALTQAGVAPEVKQQIRAVVDGKAHAAGGIGHAAAVRHQRWQAKTDQIVEARDDAIAQRQAAAAGRASKSSRACTTNRADRATQTHMPSPTHAAAGRRNLHTPEVER